MKLLKSFDFWAILISSTAVIISVRNCTDTQEQLKIYKGQARATLQIEEAKLTESILTASYITLKLKIKNFGQTNALDFETNMDYSIEPPPKGNRKDIGAMKKLEMISAGMDLTIDLTSNKINRRDWPATDTKFYSTLYVYGTLSYKDETTRIKRKEDWCYELPLKHKDDLSKLDLMESSYKYSSID